METDKNYFAVGCFVLATVIFAAFFAIWLVGAQDSARYTPYRIRFADSVSGLDVGGNVKFRGVAVGKVEKISIDPQDTRLIQVDVSILKDTPIKTDTVATMKLQGITGVVFVELSGTTTGAPNLVADKGSRDEIPVIPAKSSSIEAIINVMPEILAKVSTIADRISAVLSEDNVNAFASSMANIQQVSAAVAAQTSQIESLINNSNQIVSDSKQTIAEVARNLNNAAQQVNTLVSRTNDTAGGSYQELYGLINEMKKSARDISQLARSLKEDPSAIIVPQKEKGIPAP